MAFTYESIGMIPDLFDVMWPDDMPLLYP